MTRRLRWIVGPLFGAGLLLAACASQAAAEPVTTNEVELPPQLIVMDQTNDQGIQVIHTPGSNMYRFTFGNIQVQERSGIRFRVRTAFGTMRETASIKATAWQEGLPGDKLIETAVIRLRQ